MAESNKKDPTRTADGAGWIRARRNMAYDESDCLDADTERGTTRKASYPPWSVLFCYYCHGEVIYIQDRNDAKRVVL
jgi:hypothetical protein